MTHVTHKLNDGSLWCQTHERYLSTCEAVEAERERLAKIVDDYCDWTHWGQANNGAAAEMAAAEIAMAIRLGRALTFEEVQEADRSHTARIKAQQQQNVT